MKLVAMPGLDINHYKGYRIEWIDTQEIYRVSKKESPERACFYAGSIPEARERIDEEER